jgi:hypothetical protein
MATSSLCELGLVASLQIYGCLASEWMARGLTYGNLLVALTMLPLSPKNE